MEATEKLCSICKKNPVREGWRVCEECNDMTKGVAEIIEPKQVMHACKNCGNALEPSNLHPMIPGWCKPCVAKKGNIARNAKRNAQNSIENSDAIPEHQNGHSLTIDFSRHNEILERILQLAMDELRTPECQVLYWLINNVR